MKVVVLYHPDSEEGGMVQDYASEFERYKRKKLELISLETSQGAALAETYGITCYPAFLAMASIDGGMQRLWMGAPLPLMDEVSYYLQDDQQVKPAQPAGPQPKQQEPQPKEEKSGFPTISHHGRYLSLPA
jgi:hypothetical protein